MLFVVAVFSLVVGYYFRIWFAKRFVPQVARASQFYMLHYDGLGFRLGPAKLIVSKNADEEHAREVSAFGVTLPLGAVNVVETTDMRLAVVCIQQLHMQEQAALADARLNVDLSALFRGGGDFKNMLIYAALIIPMVIIVIIFFQFGSFGAQIATLQQSVGATYEVVSSGLVCKVE